ncbi:fimbrial biogenesis chaperone [Enterobacter cloacae]|uniref:fimbrial biogenesis chaperone n=1 Tax=Enterobacter cloacae TaxID=550 RepID=UPI0013EFAC5B|nr:molecular chaperone [Enterobacter cloacae]
MNIQYKAIGSLLTFIFCLLFSTALYSSVVLKGNRIIYPASAKEKTVEFSNNGDVPMLVQVWMDINNPDSTVDNADAPFIALPQLFRMNANSGHALRLKFTGKGLPQDRESVFWFNFMQYPAIKSADAEKNRLALVVKSRLKIFYRPDGLAGDASQALTALRIEKLNDAIVLTNPTPYHISLRNADIVTGTRKTPVGQPGMIAPFGSTRWALPVVKGGTITLYAINDYGAAVSHTVTMPQ